MAQSVSSEDKKRAYVTGRFELELDGIEVGVLHSVDGGNFKSEVIGEKVGGDAGVARHPGRQKFEEITFQCGLSMAPPFWKWVRESLRHAPSRRSGDIVALDFNSCERIRRRFEDALISEVQFPALDAKSKEPRRMTIKIAPERMKYLELNQGTSQRPVSLDARPQKQATPENFLFTIDGIERSVCQRIQKVEAFSVKQTIIDDPCGGLLYTRKEAGRIEFPTVSLSIAESFAMPFIKWFEGFVGRGENTHDHERNGSIQYYDPAFKRVLGTVTLKGLGITGITFDKHDGHGDGLRSAKVDLYVEELDFAF
jgi:phage tail-like protein